MPRKLISSGSAFEQQIGYSRAVVDGDWVFVSGTTGFDYASMSISDDLLQQAEQCMWPRTRHCDADDGDLAAAVVAGFARGHGLVSRSQ